MEYRVLNPKDGDYPRRLRERLGREAPTLYALGPLEHLSRWTLAFLTADQEPGFVIRAAWDMFFPVLEYEMNAIGPWQSVNEGVFLRSALEKPWISMTLFTAKGLERETYTSFLDARHPGRFHDFLQRPEYERRAAAGELLLLSISPPRHGRQSRAVILERNWIACHLADVVFIGGAEKITKVWDAERRKYNEKPQKTFALARRLVKTGVPIFTVDHEDNKELLALGVPGYNPKTIRPLLESLGARKGRAPELPVLTTNDEEVPSNESASASVPAKSRPAEQLKLLHLSPNPRKPG
ncbi:MAG: hypothetical protein HYY13_00965 [Nitrospirae bacterium]|nr:hypothetical protein [Nitrospirota bacterium]